MNRALLVIVLVSCAWSVPSSGAAQYVLTVPSQRPSSYLAEEDPSIDWVEERAHAGYLFDVGLGLTVGGLAATGAGIGIAFGMNLGFEAWGNVIGGGVLAGLGGVFTMIGLPLWIVGGVRADIADTRDEDRGRVAATWRDAGAAVFAISMAMAAAGGIMLGVSGFRDAEVSTAAAVLLPVGVFVALFVGAPMWSEGGRF